MKTIFTLFSLALMLTAAKAQTGLNFPDGDDYVNVPSDPLLSFDGINFTMEAWVKCTGGGYQTVAATDDTDGGTGHRGFWFGVTNFGYGGIQVFNDSWSFSTVQGTTIVNDGEWHHIAAASDGINIYVVIDGVLEGTGAHYDMVSSDHDMDLGIDAEGNDFNGTMDDVRFWWRAKSADEINLYKDSCLVAEEWLEDSLVALYSFEEGSGTAVSESAYGLNGTTMNMTDADWVEGVDCAPAVDPSGINEAENLEGAVVFYNEIQNQVNVTLTSLVDVSIKLYNMNGAIIHQANNINTTTYNFDLNAQAGMYVAVVESKGKTSHFKIIKTN